jgi:hypothetical protein
MYDRPVSLVETNRPAAERRPMQMLDLLNPDTLMQVVATALTDTAATLEFADGRGYTVTIRRGHAPMVVPDALGSWIAGHIGAHLNVTVLDAAAYQVVVTPAWLREPARQVA